MLSGDKYNCKGTSFVQTHCGTCNPRFACSRSFEKRTTLERKWRQKQSALYHNRQQLKNSKATEGQFCPLGGIWYASLWHMKERNTLSIIINRKRIIDRNQNKLFLLFNISCTVTLIILLSLSSSICIIRINCSVSVSAD